MVSVESKFLVYCIEMYRRAKGISGRDAYDLFHSTGADGYVRRCYGALHTVGERFILEDIEGYMAENGKLSANRN